MTIETEVAALTAATTALTTAVGTQQTGVNSSVAAFNTAVTNFNTAALAISNVDNTADLDKPISTLTSTALAGKQATLVSGVNVSTINGQDITSGTALVVERSATSLNRVSYDNRSTLRANTTAVTDDSTVRETLGLFMWTNTQDEPDDDETCFTTATGQWILQAPAQDLMDDWGAVRREIVSNDLEDFRVSLGHLHS
jgi:hypothetical protein